MAQGKQLHITAAHQVGDLLILHDGEPHPKPQADIALQLFAGFAEEVVGALCPGTGLAAHHHPILDPINDLRHLAGLFHRRQVETLPQFFVVHPARCAVDPFV